MATARCIQIQFVWGGQPAFDALLNRSRGFVLDALALLPIKPELAECDVLEGQFVAGWGALRCDKPDKPF
jgi:hypothetical protein